VGLASRPRRLVDALRLRSFDADPQMWRQLTFALHLPGFGISFLRTFSSACHRDGTISMWFAKRVADMRSESWRGAATMMAQSR
jgi:hypothetical protein